MKYLLLILLPLTTFAAEKTTVQSDTAHYNGKEVVLSGHVAVENTMGKVLAERAILIRDAAKKGFEAEVIHLSGTVQLINTSTGQYALADAVELVPALEEITFRAADGKRVLFYDHARDMQLSAQIIKAKRHGENGKESVQGFGDVRLVFGEEELAKFKKHFHTLSAN